MAFTKKPKHIMRITNAGGDSLYYVQMMRNRETYRKSFPDKQFGSQEKALKAANAFVEEIAKKFVAIGREPKRGARIFRKKWTADNSTVDSIICEYFDPEYYKSKKE